MSAITADPHILNVHSNLLERVSTFIEGLILTLNDTADPERIESYRWRGIEASTVAYFVGHWFPDDPPSPRDIGNIFRDLGLGPVQRVRDRDRKNLRLWPIQKLRELCLNWEGTQGDRQGDIPELLPPRHLVNSASDKGFRDKDTSSDVPFKSPVIDYLLNIFLSKPEDIQVIEETYWHSFNDGGEPPVGTDLFGIIEFSKRLLHTAELQPHSHCLTIDHALDDAGYPNLTVGLINKINGDNPIEIRDAESDDFVPLDIDHFPASALTRIVAIAAYPTRTWMWTRGEGTGIFDDDDMVAHHTCRTPNCINPLHLFPVTQATHREIHKAAGEAPFPDNVVDLDGFRD